MKLHLFDVDYTIVRRSTVREFLFFALKEGLVGYSIIWYLPGLFFNFLCRGTRGKHAEKEYPFLRGIEKSKLEALSQRVFATRLLPKLDQEILKRIKTIQSGEEKVVIASSSFLSLLEPLAKHLSIQDIVSSEIEFKDGFSTGKLSGEAAFGRGKKNRIMDYLAGQKVAESDCTFYTDSSHDLPLLQEVGRAVAVNPDRRLERIALKEGWEIIKTI
ncbi:HAD family hydrolase [Treponema sp.]